MNKLVSTLKKILDRYYYRNIDKHADVDLFMLASETPYPLSDILDFMSLTGLSKEKTCKSLRRFSECGISNIKDVNTLYKMGLLDLSVFNYD